MTYAYTIALQLPSQPDSVSQVPTMFMQLLNTRIRRALWKRASNFANPEMTKRATNSESPAHSKACPARNVRAQPHQFTWLHITNK
jgi:hypothetical protein